MASLTLPVSIIGAGDPMVAEQAGKLAKFRFIARGQSRTRCAEMTDGAAGSKP